MRLPTAFAVTSVASKALVRHLWRKPVLKVLFAVMWPQTQKVKDMINPEMILDYGMSIALVIAFIYMTYRVIKKYSMKNETTDSNSTNALRVLALEGHQPS